MTGTAAILLGLAIISLGAVLLTMNLRFVRASQLTMAKVVGYRESKSTDWNDSHGTYYFPQFEFRTKTGRAVRAEANAGDAQPEWPVGETIPIRYLPDRPEKVRPDGARHVFVTPILIGLVGTFFVALGLAQ